MNPETQGLDQIGSDGQQIDAPPQTVKAVEHFAHVKNIRRNRPTEIARQPAGGADTAAQAALAQFPDDVPPDESMEGEMQKRFKVPDVYFFDFNTPGLEKPWQENRDKTEDYFNYGRLYKTI